QENQPASLTPVTSAKQVSGDTPTGPRSRRKRVFCAMNLRQQQNGGAPSKADDDPIGDLAITNSTCATPRMLPTLALQTMRFSEDITFRPRRSATTQP